jgi:hypothetical protein
MTLHIAMHGIEPCTFACARTSRSFMQLDEAALLADLPFRTWRLGYSYSYIHITITHTISYTYIQTKQFPLCKE